MRHVAAFLSVCIVCTARDIAVLSDPTREKCFVAMQTTLSLCRRDKRDFPARDCSALLHRVLAYYLCTPLMESRISLRDCSFRSQIPILADTVKMKVSTRCYCSRAPSNILL